MAIFIAAMLTPVRRPGYPLHVAARDRTGRVWLSVLGARARSATMGTVTTVLIVDDHPSFRATARALLEAEGFDVIGDAPDGESAIEAVRRLGPELVLLDVQLPGMSGF